jgi:hypothetical protein
MTRRLFYITIACAVFAGMLVAADVSGTWTGSMAFGDQQIALSYTFKQDGAKLTGSVTGPGGELPLAEGKVEGDKLSFSVTVDMNGAPSKFMSTGTIKGEEIELVTKNDAFASPPMTLKRSK